MPAQLGLKKLKNFVNLWFLYELRQGFDITDEDVENNLLSEVGFLKALLLALRLQPFGLYYGALPCDSFGWMSCGTHGRSATSPGGKPHPFVVEGNIVLCRWMMLALIAVVRGCVWMAENPGRTTLQVMPAMKHLMSEKLRPLMVRWFETEYVRDL